jgi:DnaK suppressor protein
VPCRAARAEFKKKLIYESFLVKGKGGLQNLQAQAYIAAKVSKSMNEPRLCAQQEVAEMASKVSKELQELTPDEVLKLKEVLLKTRETLHEKSRERKAEGMYEISRDDLADEADLASVETAQDVGMKLAEHDRHKLNLVEKALKKIEANDGSYGLCEGTGEPIGFRRLEVQPWVLYSLRYQEELERGRRG